MLVRLCIHVVLMCSMVGLVTSCAEHKKQAGTPFAAWVPPGNVPPALEEIGNRAVDIIDLADMDDWPQVYALVQNLSDAWSDYKHPTVAPPSYPRPASSLLYSQLDTALSRLKEAAAARDGAQTMRAANDVDAAAAELIEFYNPAIPPELHRLVALERKIMLDSWDGRIDAAPDTLIEVRRRWNRVRPVVVDHSSVEAVEAFEDSITAQQRAIDTQESSTLGYYAENAIVMLREMEQLSY
jgi:hypothetical protein